jgi:predicted transcriptional regulator
MADKTKSTVARRKKRLMTIRLNPELFDKIEIAAAKDRRSLSFVIADIVEKAFDKAA